MYADNGMLNWIGSMPKEAWDFLDYKAIGEEIKNSEDGLFTEDGYFTCNDKEFVEVYDGEKFPEVFEDDKYIFKLFIETKDGTVQNWLVLPASKEGKANFLKGLGVDSFDDCMLMLMVSFITNLCAIR